MSIQDDKMKILQESELGPPLEDNQLPSKEELMNKLTLAIILSAIAPTLEQAEEATRHAETIISMGLTEAETETCKKKSSLGRIQSGDESSCWFR